MVVEMALHKLGVMLLLLVQVVEQVVTMATVALKLVELVVTVRHLTFVEAVVVV
jgi:hypothetical protein